MMDPISGRNRGYCFVTFTEKKAAEEAVKQVLQVCVLLVVSSYFPKKTSGDGQGDRNCCRCHHYHCCPPAVLVLMSGVLSLM